MAQQELAGSATNNEATQGASNFYLPCTNNFNSPDVQQQIEYPSDTEFFAHGDDDDTSKANNNQPEYLQSSMP